VAVIVVTRLRLKDHSYLDDFFAAAVALVEQAKSSRGILGTDALAEANDTWWSCTAWDNYDSMRSFVNTDPHKSTMSRLDDWCSEASFVDWEQVSAQLPDWQESYRRIRADGTSANLTDPTDTNASRNFPPPVENSST
jgi:heme-degrading monooxygenase HmoA